MIFDSHLHLIDRGRLRYPWLADAPPLDRDWTLAAYQTTAQRVGITGALHMEVDVAQPDIDAETAWVAEMMAQPGSILRGAISAARPEDAGFQRWLDAVDPGVVKGLRRVLHVVPDEVSQGTVFRDNIRRLGQAGLPFDLCLQARQLHLGIALADAAPDTTFVLDHCGVPDIAGGAFEPWAASITALAERPNVNVKLSGIVAYAGDDWTFSRLRPWAEHVIEKFTPYRTVWGSDSPVCTIHSSLEEWVAVSLGVVDRFSQQERQAILLGNAFRIWKLMPR